MLSGHVLPTGRDGPTDDAHVAHGELLGLVLNLLSLLLHQLGVSHKLVQFAVEQRHVLGQILPAAVLVVTQLTLLNAFLWVVREHGVELVQKVSADMQVQSLTQIYSVSFKQSWFNLK